MGNLCSANTDGLEPQFSSAIAPSSHQAPAKSNQAKGSNDDNPFQSQLSSSTELASLPVTTNPTEHKKLDPKDFIISKKENQVIIREPGQIAGQSFAIEDCTNCDIYLLDHSAAVTIDCCTDCRLFIGPCESSVFIRDCSGCRLVVAAQQLRLRDSKDLWMLLFVSASQPVIEGSDGLRIGCFPAGSVEYPELSGQFGAAGLCRWQSEWSNIHDFHADPDGDAGEDRAGIGRHWDFLPAGAGLRELGMREIGEVTAGRVVVGHGSGPVLPYTWGQRPRVYPGPPPPPPAPALVFILAPYYDEVGFALIEALSGSGSKNPVLYLLRSKQKRLSESGSVSWLGRVVKEAVVGLEWECGGVEARQLISEVISEKQWGNDRVVLVEEEKTKAAIENFFEAVSQV